MNDEEQCIVNYLQGSPDSFFARREIARKAVRRSEYEENPRWAEAPLALLVDKEVVEMNDGGHYRLNTSNQHRRSG
ncbi:MAG: hypothetical protein MUF81_03190 [Verrucomicrobia bacterium]|jgi:hypothetical protein|nr:hypothetical protein [Verrucomicrobiota bacterium]